ncbi:MAG: GGDEF domain-containing protein [Oscillospiraceae bacterium]|nr:GGDEF domain-containing protein [Oscillospiraceae bacterium]
MPDRACRIAVVVSGINEEYQNQVISGAERFAAEHSVRLFLFADMGGLHGVAAHDAGEYNIYSLLRYEQFDGVILLTNTVASEPVRQEILSAVRTARIPAVVMDAGAAGMAAVTIDNYAAMRQIAEHLTDHHKCRRIAYLGGPRHNPESEERLHAVLDVLNERGLSLHPRQVWEGSFLSADGTAAVKQLLADAADPRYQTAFPEAIICANDVMAVAAMNALAANGIRVPQDVIVTGFDHTFAGRNFSPELTSVNRGLAEAGALACKMLLYHEVQPGITQTVRRGTSPVFSESCGCRERTADSEAAFRRQSCKTADQYIGSARMNSRMSCAFGACETLPQLMTALRSFVPEMPCSGFWLCLNADWLGDTDAMLAAAASGMQGQYRTKGYPARMRVPLAYENGVFTAAEDFASEQMLPPCASDIAGGSDYFFPLHFRSRSFGYCVMRGNAEMLQSPAVFSWMITLGNALEHIRKLCCTHAVVARLEQLYVMDALTGIYNRSGFARETAKLYQQAVQLRQPVMVLFADLDGLKEINDRFGHSAGDTALRAVGQAMKNVCHSGEIYTRFGGDEFLIFAADKTEAECSALADALQDELRCFNEQGDAPFTVSVSIGYCLTVPQPDTSVFTIIAEADQKMYEEKKKRTTSKYLRK